jgi:hypothetical protein
MSDIVMRHAHEGLLEAAPAYPCARGIRMSCPSKNAQATKPGAGRYFTLKAGCESDGLGMRHGLKSIRT